MSIVEVVFSEQASHDVMVVAKFWIRLCSNIAQIFDGCRDIHHISGVGNSDSCHYCSIQDWWVLQLSQL